MSTFKGKIIEIPDISVDCFENANENSLVYFLSHCHTDHMSGLRNWSFQTSLLVRPEVYLYSTPISVTILKHLHPQIESKLIEIAIYDSTLIKIPYKETHLTVTALPAGHCPGSVMFLFETIDKTILYTGDYRVSASDLRKYKPFYSLDKVKRIDKMYLDTTFLNLSYFKLPPRSDSINQMFGVIQEWIKQSSAHIIKILPSATYGSEYLFMEISKAVGMPIHVNSTTYNLYKCIPEMDKSVTLKSTETQIHANCGGQFKKICKEKETLIRTIIPSTLWWKNKNTDHIMEVDKGDYRVCYSCHASFEEIEEFLLFLKPVEVEPCVVPNHPTEREQMFELLDKVMASYQSKRTEENEKCKLFQDRKNEEKTPEKNDNFGLEDVLGSPISTFKRKRLWLQTEED